jgi:replication-associated recombination protein RarA
MLNAQHPVLLTGCPGVGKTALVQVRIAPTATFNADTELLKSSYCKNYRISILLPLSTIFQLYPGGQFY